MLSTTPTRCSKTPNHTVRLAHHLGKIDADPADLAAAIEAAGFIELPVHAAHAVGVAKLAVRHNDPFDRLLIAQALAEPLSLLTADTMLARYSDIVVLV